MFDVDDYLNMFNSSSYGTTTTETEEETSQESQTSYGSQTTYNPYNSVQTSFDDDDYSVAPNYSEEQSYNGVSRTVNDDEEVRTQSFVRKMDMPLIEKEEPAVNLIKKRERIELQARMKIMITVFSVTVVALIFAIIWNFVSVGKMKSTFAGKQVEIAQLQSSISGLTTEYTNYRDLNSEEVQDWIKENDFVERSDDNSVEIELDYQDSTPVIEDIPSNWFNDLCDFFSNLFAA